jgi:hypothetical protein
MEAEFLMTRRFLRRSHLSRLFHRWWIIAIAILMMAPNVIGDLRSHELGGVSIFAITALGILVLRYSYACFRQFRMIDDWTSKQGDNPVTYEFDLETVTASSAVGKTTLKWSAFKRLVITPLHTLLEFPRGAGALTIPTGQVRRETSEFLIQRFRAHGLAVENKCPSVQVVATNGP